MDELEGVLFQQGNYIVVVIPDHVINGKAMDAYAVVNIQTAVKEYETRFLWDAMQWAKRCNKFVDEFLMEAEGQNSLSWPEGIDEALRKDSEEDSHDDE